VTADALLRGAVATPAPRQPVLGIIGAGQLARMTYQASLGLGQAVRILAADPTDSAATTARDVTVASLEDPEGLLAFASTCDVITFDHELVDPRMLQLLEQHGHVLRPSAGSLRHGQDKLHQRRRLASAGHPVPAFRATDTLDELVGFGQRIGWPVVVKAVRGGYDGRGVWIAANPDDARRIWDEARARGVALFAEAHVPIVRELAVGVARRPSGHHVTYPVTETVQSDGICIETVAPIVGPIADAATALARAIVHDIGAVGMVAVELFDTGRGLVINEVALRPHNSMHWTIEGARTSQFQNHIRAVLDLPLGSPDPVAPCAVMVNVIGRSPGDDPANHLASALATPDIAVHLYGKMPRPGRKLGHVTALGDDTADTRLRAHRAARALTPTGAAA
jgi:5-(carboxyamino)imidazole ribonucleotide synthase